MSGPAIEYAYRYPFPSEAISQPTGVGLRLATCGGEQEQAHFFRGNLLQPRTTADLLRALVDVVQSRFYIPPAMLARLSGADPGVTSGGNVLRFEAFSACCSAYARVDLLPGAMDGEWLGRGTTNVDFNAPMRAALARIRDSDGVVLLVGAETVELSRGVETLVERKVALPVRWLKGFVEVQACQARMEQVLEVSGLAAQRFLRSLPRGAATVSGWVVAAAGGLRFSQVATKDAVRVGGVQRLRILEDLAPHARMMRVYVDEATQASGWELVLDDTRFHFVISPDVTRGFSGEGQVLADLAARRWEDVLPRIQASLNWEARIDAEDLARRFALGSEDVASALALLGSRGLVGFDLADGTYFQRVLPFDISLVESLHPRLKGTRRIVAGGGVRLDRRNGGIVEACVAGTDVEHRVRLGPDGAKCSCLWYARHQGGRGPCKHVLAVQLALEGEE